MSAVAVENARLQWEDGYRRLNEHASDRPVYLDLLAQVDVVIDELNRRVGQTFALADLAAAYEDADRWLLEVLPPGAGAIQLGLVEDAAFHLYARLRAMSRHPRKRRRRVVPWVLRAAALAIVLVIGIALGQAFDDSSAPSGTETSVRTLEPGTQSVPTVTVTVTTTP